MGVQKIERRGGKIVYNMLLQSDLKVKITPAIIGAVMPKGIQDWFKALTRYLNDNYERI